jgi:hypothetical protein
MSTQTSNQDTPTVVAYWVKRQAYENNGSDLIRMKLSDGTITEEGRQPQTHWPFNDQFKNANCLERHSF